jgi:hypothetical protein
VSVESVRQQLEAVKITVNEGPAFEEFNKPFEGDPMAALREKAAECLAIVATCDTALETSIGVARSSGEHVKKTREELGEIFGSFGHSSHNKLIRDTFDGVREEELTVDGAGFLHGYIRQEFISYARESLGSLLHFADNWDYYVGRTQEHVDKANAARAKVNESLDTYGQQYLF